VRIVDLARDMIRLYGYSENEVRITFTGLRPGEKLYEEVLADDEQTLPTPHPKLRIARAREVSEDWLRELVAWLERPAVLDDASVRTALQRWVAEYRTGQPAAGSSSLAQVAKKQPASSGS
jgi:FlaA1/EpsC-like NDP-sugar epimerase